MPLPRLLRTALVPLVTTACAALLLPGCAHQDDSSTPIARHVTPDSPVLASLPPVSPLFAAAPQLSPTARLRLITQTPSPAPVDAAQVIRQVAAAKEPVSAPPSPLPKPSEVGLLVCAPIPANAAQGAFGAACGRWLQLIAAGQPVLGRTPMWEAMARAQQELGRTDLRLTPEEAATLPDMLGVTHVAVGRLAGDAAHSTLTYQLLRVPSKTPIGASLSVSGTQAQVVAALPGLARTLASRLGVSAPSIPASVGLSAAEMVQLGTWESASDLSDADLLALSQLSRRSPLVGMDFLDTRASDDQVLLAGTIKTLRSQLPDNALVLSHICYNHTDALRSDAPALATLIARSPQSSLLAHAEVWMQREWGTRTREWQAAQRCPKDDPHSPEAWLTIAYTLSQVSDDARKGRTAGAMTEADWSYLRPIYQRWEYAAWRATVLDPQFGRAWLRLAQAATFSGDERRADDAFWHAQRLPGSHAELYAWGLQMYQPKWGGAPATLDKVAHLAAAERYADCDSATDIAAELGSLGEYLKEPNDTKLADTVMAQYTASARDAVRRQPDRAGTHWALAGALAQQSDSPSLRESTLEYRTATHLMPNCANLHYWLGQTLDKRGRQTEAIPEYRQAVALAPFSVKAHDALGYDLKHERQFAEATSELRLALHLSPQDAEVYADLGDLCEMQKNHKAAIDAYRGFLRLQPLSPPIWERLASTLDEDNQYDAVIAAGQEAERLNLINDPSGSYLEQEADLLDTVADAYLHKKDYAASIRESQNALTMYPSDALAHENLGEAYIGQGHKAEAHAEWEQVLKMDSADMAAVARKMLAQYP